jgi:hypothetical protein
LISMKASTPSVEGDDGNDEQEHHLPVAQP